MQEERKVPASNELIETKGTFGEKLVGLKFNPSNDDKVGNIKRTFADLADMVMSNQQTPEGVDPYLFNLVKGDCLRKILDTQMILVKLVTLKY